MCAGSLALVASAASAAGTTYNFVGADRRGNYSDLSNWEDAGGNNPAYAPTDANCNPEDTYVVKDGKRTRDSDAGPANMQIYGRVVYGEVGGTVGNHYEESQYPRSGNAKLNFRHTDGATFANGTYTAGNLATDSTWGNRVLGKIAVTAPATAPYVFTTQNSTDGRYIYFENAFVSDGNAGMKFNDAGRANWQFLGDLSGYLGSMAFAKDGSTALFGANCGTTDLKALSFAAAMTVTVENVTAPLKAETLTVAGGTVFALSAKTDGASIACASLSADQLALTGEGKIRIVLGEFADPVLAKSATFDLPLVTVCSGGLSENAFDVDFGGRTGRPESRGISVKENTDGSVSLVATFAFEKDDSYHLTAAGTNKNPPGSFGVEMWENAQNENPAHAITDPLSVDIDYTVDQGRLLNIGAYTGTAGTDFYGHTVTFGSVGGSTGRLGIYSQYWVNHNRFLSPLVLANGDITLFGTAGDRHCEFTASATVTAPASVPFQLKPNGANLGTIWHLTLAGDETVGLKAGNTADRFWTLKFDASLSSYRGALDFSVGHVDLTFSANAGTIDLNAFSIGAASTVTVQNASAPFKAKTLTVADGALFNLATGLVGSDVLCATLDCETLVRAAGAKVRLAVADFGEPAPSKAAQTVKLVLVKAKNGGLALDDFEVDLGIKALAAEFKGLSIEDGEDDEQSLVATFAYAGDSAYYLTADASNKDPEETGCLGTTTIWEDVDGANPPSALTSPDSSSLDFAVNQGRRLRVGLYTARAGQTFYGKSIVFGRIGGTQGSLRIDSQYLVNSNRFDAPLTFANGSFYFNGYAGGKTCEFAASATVTAPVSAPFTFTLGGPGMTTLMHLALRGEEGVCLARGDSAKSWNPSFLSDLSGYRGALDFSGGNVNLTFGADTGTIDLSAFSIGAASTVTVQNVSAPFKAKALTVADGTVFNLASAEDRLPPECSGDELVAELSSAYEVTGIKVASLEAQALTLAGSVTLRLADLPKIPRKVTALTLVKAAAGTLDASRFTVEIGGLGARHFKGVKMVTTADGDALVAEFDHPGVMLLVR